MCVFTHTHTDRLKILQLKLILYLYIYIIYTKPTYKGINISVEQNKKQEVGYEFDTWTFSTIL